MDSSTALGQLIGILSVIGLPLLRLAYRVAQSRLKDRVEGAVLGVREETRQTKEMKAINHAISPDPTTTGWMQESSKRTDDLTRRLDRFEDNVIRNFSEQFKELRRENREEKQELVDLMRTRQDGLINQIAHMKRGYTEDIEELRKAVASLRIQVERIGDDVEVLKKAS